MLFFVKIWWGSLQTQGNYHSTPTYQVTQVSGFLPLTQNAQVPRGLGEGSAQRGDLNSKLGSVPWTGQLLSHPTGQGGFMMGPK